MSLTDPILLGFFLGLVIGLLLGIRLERLGSAGRAGKSAARRVWRRGRR
jgi:ABC-type nitrate/sulfonate/bicarbonate transport system permease component